MDTYELTDYKLSRERLEWDDFWFEQTLETEKTRVFYIGDSISRQIRRVATEESNNEILFDNYSTSKGLDNPFLIEGISWYARQEEKRDIVLFNNGLHGWHLEDETEYRFYFEKTVEFMKEYFKDTPVAVVLTTYIKKDGLSRVCERNKAAKEICEKHNIHIIDLYTVSEENKETMRDPFHFNDDGVKILAKKLIADVKKILNL